MTKLVVSIDTIQTLLAQVDIANNFLLRPGKTVAGSKLANPAGMLSVLLPNIYIISGIILLFLMIMGGFTIVAGGDNPEQIQKGQKTLVGAIIGFMVIFISYWVVQLIETITGITILNSGIL